MRQAEPGKIHITHIPFLFMVALLGWWVPGAGHLLIGRIKHAIIIFASIAFAFTMGIYIASIAVIDPVNDILWYWAQILNSPLVILLARVAQSHQLRCFARPREIGQIYTAVAGLLNLLCIVNAVYLAHCDKAKINQD